MPDEEVAAHAFGAAVAVQPWIGAPGGAQRDAVAGVMRFQPRVNPADPVEFVPMPIQTFLADELELGPRFGASVAVGTAGPACCGSMAVGSPAETAPLAAFCKWQADPDF